MHEVELGAMTLPHGLPDGLHMLEPSSWWKWLIALALALLAAWLWRRRRRAPPAGKRPPSPKPEKPAGGDANVIRRIAEIRQRYRLTADFRRGCHELASTIRGHLETGGSDRPQALTARELEARYGEAIGRLMQLVADLQWRRRRPQKEEFDDACSLAIDVLSVTRGRKL